MNRLALTAGAVAASPTDGIDLERAITGALTALAIWGVAWLGGWIRSKIGR